MGGREQVPILSGRISRLCTACCSSPKAMRCHPPDQPLREEKYKSLSFLLQVEEECLIFLATQFGIPVPSGYAKYIDSVNARIQQRRSVHYVAVVHALEGWLLTDSDAITKCFGPGAKVRIRNRAASDCRPKKVMKEIFRKVGKYYLATRDAPQIAERIDMDKVADRNESFARFRERVTDP